MGGLAQQTAGYPLGLAGATAATRYVGATSTGAAPVAGTFAKGDFTIDWTTPTVWICTVAGTPGTWTDITATAAGALLIANNLSDVANRQTALDNLAGAVTSGRVLRGDGTHVSLAALQAGDVPTLNQNTTGTAGGLSSTLAVNKGGTGVTDVTAFAAAFGGTWQSLTLGTNVDNVSATNSGCLLDAAGIVHLKGFLSGTSGHNITPGQTIATLPVGFRPSDPGGYACTANTGAAQIAGILFIQTDGTILWNLGGVNIPAAGVGYITLHGVCFPAYV